MPCGCAPTLSLWSCRYVHAKRISIISCVQVVGAKVVVGAKRIAITLCVQVVGCFVSCAQSHRLGLYPTMAIGINTHTDDLGPTRISVHTHHHMTVCVIDGVCLLVCFD